MRSNRIGRRHWAAVFVVSALALCAIPACTVTAPEDPKGGGNTNNNNNVNQVIINPAPNPSGSPGPNGGVSDVDHLAIFAYGIGCGSGTAPDPGEYRLPAGCTSLALTATPKTNQDKNGDGKDDDAVNHGRNLHWEAQGAVADLLVDQNETFNATVRTKTPRLTGVFVVTATLIAPDGKSHLASRSITIQ